MIDPNQLAAQLKQQKLPPVDQWDPPFCGDMDMVIKRDGSWHYLGSPIGRMPLVKLFASVIRKDGDEYFLVTPVEKVRIQVDDAPFVAVLVDVMDKGDDQQLVFTDNLGNQTVAGAEHPIQVIVDPETEQPSPYILVRKNLHALIHRSVFYQLVEMANTVTQGNKKLLHISSAGETFELGQWHD